LSPTDLRAILDQLGMSQLRLAQVLGVNPVTVRRWVSNKRPTPIPEPIARILRLAAAGRINLNEMEQ
jgi:transcriptional regulator with XRE-family HTH domain